MGHKVYGNRREEVAQSSPYIIISGKTRAPIALTPFRVGYGHIERQYHAGRHRMVLYADNNRKAADVGHGAEGNVISVPLQDKSVPRGRGRSFIDFP